MSYRPSLTRKQAKVLEAISLFLDGNHYPPSMRQLGGLLGLSPGTVHYHIHSLMKKGYLLHDGTDHGLTLVDRSLDRGPRLPLLGSLKADQPIDMDSDPEGYVEVTESFSQDGAFALRIEGGHLERFGIHDGDHAIIRQTRVPQDGALALVVQPDESATIATVFTTSDGRYITNPETEVEILGRLLGLIRHFI